MQLVFHVLGSVIFDFLDDYQLINWIMQPFEWIDIGILYRMRPLLFDGFLISEMLHAERITVQKCLQLKIWTKRECCATEEMDEILKCSDHVTLVDFCSMYITSRVQRKLLQECIIRLGPELETWRLIALLQFVDDDYICLSSLIDFHPFTPNILQLFRSLKLVDCEKLIQFIERNIWTLPIDVVDELLHHAGPTAHKFASLFKETWYTLNLQQLTILQKYNLICFDDACDVLASPYVMFDTFVFFWRADIPVEGYLPSSSLFSGGDATTVRFAMLVEQKNKCPQELQMLINSYLEKIFQMPSQQKIFDCCVQNFCELPLLIWRAGNVRIAATTRCPLSVEIWRSLFSSQSSTKCFELLKSRWGNMILESQAPANQTWELFTFFKDRGFFLSEAFTDLEPLGRAHIDYVKLIWSKQTHQKIGPQWSALIRAAIRNRNRELIQFLSSIDDLPVTKNDNWFMDNLVELCSENYCDIIQKYSPYFCVPNDVLKCVFTACIPYCNVDCLQTLHEAKLWPASIQLHEHWKTDNVVWLLQKGLISQRQCFESLSKQTLQTIATRCLIQLD